MTGKTQSNHDNLTYFCLGDRDGKIKGGTKEKMIAIVALWIAMYSTFFGKWESGHSWAVLPKPKRSDPKTGTVAGATDILAWRAWQARVHGRGVWASSMVMLKKKGVFDAMRSADVLVVPSLGGPSSRITRVVVSVSSGAYDSCLERPVRHIRRLCWNKLWWYTGHTAHGSFMIATTVSFPLLPYDRRESKRYSTSLCQLAARHQQMSAHVTALREMQSWMNSGAVLLVRVHERAPSLIYFVHFAYLASILRLASPDSIAEIFFLWRRVFMYHASSQCLLEISQSGKNNPVLSGDR